MKKLDVNNIKSFKYLLILFIVFTVTMVSCSSTNSMPPAIKTYNEILLQIQPLTDNLSNQFHVDQTDKPGVEYFINKLKDFGIDGGIVKINSKLRSNGNLDYCVAINTIDRGVVFFTVLSNGIDVEDGKQRLQYVYLAKGEKVGLLSAQFAASNDYSWYISYLNDVYTFFDYGKYLSELKGLLDTFGKCVDRSQLMMWTASQTDIDAANRLIDKYNIYIDDFNDQIETYNNKLNKYPENLFYIEEHSSDLSGKYKLYTPVPLPVLITGGLDQLSSQMQKIVNLDKDSCKVERVTEKNFVVDDYNIRW